MAKNSFFYGSKMCYSQAEAQQLQEALPQDILVSDGAVLLGGTSSLCSSTERRNLHFKHTIKRIMDACR